MRHRCVCRGRTTSPCCNCNNNCNCQRSGEAIHQLHTQCHRCILGIRWYDFISNASITAQTNLGLPDISAVIKSRRLALFGHARRLSPGAPGNGGYNVQGNSKSPLEADRLHRNVICKLPNYGLQMEIGQSGGCYGRLVTKRGKTDRHRVMLPVNVRW